MLVLLLLFLLPILGAFRVSLVGELSLAEPIVIGIALFNYRKFVRTWLRVPVVKTIVTLAALWLLEQIGTDLYRGTPAVDYLRGWLKIVVMIASYAACAAMIGTNIRRAIAVAAGAMVMPVVNYVVYRSDISLYKFVIGAGVSFAAFFVARWLGRGRPMVAMLVPVAAGVLALFLDCRSLAGITLCAAAYASFLSAGLLKEGVSAKRRVLFGGIWLICSIGLVRVYSTLAASGELSQGAREKYETQVDSSGHFDVFSGRSEVLFSVPKILQSPLVGWGSWAKDVIYVEQRAEVMGMDPARVLSETSGLIPTHSHLFGAWLEAGVCGAIFWIYIITLIAKIFARAWLGGNLAWCGVLSFLLVNFAWDIVFSPFGGERRFNNGLYLWIITITVIGAIQRGNERRAHRRRFGVAQPRCVPMASHSVPPS